MENAGDWEQKCLITELTQGRELVKQLRTRLDSSVSKEMRDVVVEKIQSSFDKALSILKWSGSDGELQAIGTSAGMSECLRSDSGSPRSDDSDRRDTAKKRKTLPRWTEQVRVCSGKGLEGPPDDGFSWRKYGQKDILGAKYPRGYYRCTHRHVQGCLATKQLQRTDEDPSIFNITYQGRHTCLQASHLMQAIGSSEKHEPKPNQDYLQQQQQQQQQKKQQSQEILLNFQSGLKVETNHLDPRELTSSSSFSFPSTSIGCYKAENHIVSPSTLDNNFKGSFSPSFLSPTTTSESNYFSMSPCRMNNFGGVQNLHTSESDFTEIISAATSATNSSILDLDFALDSVELDPNFPFNTPGFFSS